MNDLDPKAKALLDSIRGADGPTRRDKARVKRRVLTRVAGVLLAASAGTSSLTTAASAGTVAAGVWSAKLVVVAIAASALVAGGAASGVVAWHQHVRHHSGAPAEPRAGLSPASARVVPSPPAPAKAEALAGPEAPVGVTNPVTTDAISAAPRVPAGRSSASASRAPPPSRETLEEELPLLQSAQEALRLGETERALALLDAHAKRFPDGALSEERRAVHALTACRKTGDPSARAEAVAFLRDSPSSPLVESVRKACSLEGP